MSDHGLPLVSVITPSYNQAKYIQETIESILTQDYPHVELIVVDGGSTDGTLPILQKYSHYGERFRFVSEKDRGQSHAINKGVAMAKGEIIGWVNSDDMYQPGAIRKAVEALQNHPEWAMAYGKAKVINEKSKVIREYHVRHADYQRLFEGCMICQPAVFMRKEVLLQVGGVDESLQFCMDYDLWIRISKHHRIGFIPDYLANARTHKACKSIRLWRTVGIREVIRTCAKHYGTISNAWMTHFLKFYSSEGLSGLFRCLRETGAFGHSLRISSTNRFNDFWVPPRFCVYVESAPQSPLRSLLVRGRLFRALPPNFKFTCSVLINGQMVGSYLVGQSFLLEIPIHSEDRQNHIEIVAPFHFSSRKHPDRLVSFVVSEIVPLSAEETKLFRQLPDTSPVAKTWIARLVSAVPRALHLQRKRRVPVGHRIRRWKRARNVIRVQRSPQKNENGKSARQNPPPVSNRQKATSR